MTDKITTSEQLVKMTSEQIVDANAAGLIDHVAISAERRQAEAAAAERNRHIGELIRAGLSPSDALERLRADGFG